jgi:hypothetical protein
VLVAVQHHSPWVPHLRQHQFLVQPYSLGLFQQARLKILVGSVPLYWSEDGLMVADSTTVVWRIKRRAITKTMM